MWLLLILIIFVVIYSLIKRQYTYWDHSNIPHVKSKFPYGNLEKVVKKEGSFGTAIYDIYKQSTEPLIGIYLFFKPAILIRDPELIKNVLIKDFGHFHSRGVYLDSKRDPMSSNLFSLEGEEWKALRKRLTPAFTSGKLKDMFENLKLIGDSLVKHFEKLAEKEAEIDIRDFAGCYVADCLASIAFGQSGVSTIENPEHEFRNNVRKLNDNSKTIEIIRRTAVFMCPGLVKLLRLKGLPQYMREFCLRMVTNAVEDREKNNIVRKDLMQYLIQLRNSGVNGVIDNNEWNVKKSDKTQKSLSIEEIAANVFLFYIAGNETSSSTIAYTLYEFTQNEEILRRAYEDIERTLEKHDGVLSYEAIMDMKFLDLSVKETLRKYPGLPVLNRECSKDYHIPDSSFVIKKGTSVLISLLGIHRNEKFFPNPEKYDPDRFSDENKNYDEDMYMPFGAGPRNCIAFRMGLLMAKVAIVMLLKNYHFEALSIRELEFDHGTVGLLPKPGMCKIKILPKQIFKD